MDTFFNFIYASIIASTPLLFGTVGEILSEKVGNMNLGVEGMMWLGAFAGFYAAYKTESFLISLLASFGLAAVGALIYAFLTVTLKANQNVTGLTLTTFGIGLSLVFGKAMITAAGGAPKTSDVFNAKVAAINIPVLSDIPYIGKIIFGLNPYVYIAVAIAIILYVYLMKTKMGLNLRAIGENPAAADASGINVNLMKYINIIIGGGICGIGGAYMSLVMVNGSWQDSGVVNGYGWIAVALVIFSSWNPAKAILGSLIFGMFSSLRYYVPSDIIVIPTAFYQMLPFVVTIIVLIVTSIKKNKENTQPAACGINYFREER